MRWLLFSGAVLNDRDCFIRNKGDHHGIPDKIGTHDQIKAAGHQHSGSALASLFGGWDAALKTLIIFMAIDYITGLIVAGVFKTSEKTENGALESRAGWKGLCRTGVTLLGVDRNRSHPFEVIPRSYRALSVP